jgi:hypothetical protein
MATLAQALDAGRKGGSPRGGALRTLARTLLLLTTIPSALAVAGCSAALVQRDDVTTHATATTAPAHPHAETHSHRFRALLAPQPPPDCVFKGSDVDALDTDLWAQLKLDYERHCYQHAEATVRARLRQLQVSGVCEIDPVRHRRRFLGQVIERAGVR